MRCAGRRGSLPRRGARWSAPVTYAARSEARKTATLPMSRGGHPAERDGPLDRGDPLVAAVVQVGLLGAHHPDVDRVDPDVGPHSTASVRVSESRPAFAAPYAAVPGEGRSADTEEMLTIEPPTLRCITRWAAWRRSSGESRFRPTILSWKFGEASRCERVRRAAGVVDQHVEPAVRGDDPVDQRLRPTSGSAHVARRRGRPVAARRPREREQVTTVAPASRNASAMPRPTPRSRR